MSPYSRNNTCSWFRIMVPTEQPELIYLLRPETLPKMKICVTVILQTKCIKGMKPRRHSLPIFDNLNARHSIYTNLQRGFDSTQSVGHISTLLFTTCDLALYEASRVHRKPNLIKEKLKDKIGRLKRVFKKEAKTKAP